MEFYGTLQVDHKTAYKLFFLFWGYIQRGCAINCIILFIPIFINAEIVSCIFAKPEMESSNIDLEKFGYWIYVKRIQR